MKSGSSGSSQPQTPPPCYHTLSNIGSLGDALSKCLPGIVEAFRRGLTPDPAAFQLDRPADSTFFICRVFNAIYHFSNALVVGPLHLCLPLIN